VKIGETLKIEYDDDQVAVMDKVNEALEEHGLQFVDDGLPHDEGFCLYKLERTTS
jgi:hypothetical protein